MNSKLEKYLEFLATKLPRAEEAGFVPSSYCEGCLFPHQRDICQWAVKGGRRAVFANFGLGKTRMHLQIAKWVVEKTGGRYLIVAPLGVRQEFMGRDGRAMGCQVRYVRTDAEVAGCEDRILITNYERVRDGNITVGQFAGAGLDEASVLRSFGSETYQRFLGLFGEVGYRYVFTATPSPNRYKELIHYAGFLGIMDTGEALTRFFKRDSSSAGNLTLMPHMEETFWHWVRSWAAFIQRPSDLGYSDKGYDLPPMEVVWHRLEIDHTKQWKDGGHFDGWGQAQMFVDPAVGLKQSAAVKRESIALRIERAKLIMAEAAEGERWLLWHDLEAEREAIEKLIPEALTAYGSQDLEVREGIIGGFAEGQGRILATKPSIAGSGCNFQRGCSDAIFLGVGYKFNDFIQAIHRIHRFQQVETVRIHIIYLDTEDAICEALKAKWRRHDELMGRMSDLMRGHGLGESGLDLLRRTIGVNRRERGELLAVA